jgi:pilus assembly protein CpaB
LKRRVLTVVLACLLGIAGIVAVLAYVNKANQRALDGQQAVSVLVANDSIPQGTSVGQAVSGGLLVRRDFPASSLPAGTVRSASHGLSRLVTTSAMQKGQLLLTTMLGRRGQVSGGIAVPTGDIAVTVQVCLEAAIAGYIQPGAKVALFDTYATKGQLESSCSSSGSSHQAQNLHNVYTRMVLPKVEVLSVTTAGSTTAGAQGTSALSAGASTQSQGALYVTLAVSQRDAEQVILASQAGLPYFGLLTPDSVTEPDSGSQLFSSKP